MRSPVPEQSSDRGEQGRRAASVRWPALDGLRALAVLAVVGFHLNLAPVGHWYDRFNPRGGFLGVDIFFVVSGFLITTLLIGEYGKRGRISFKNFYARRALRLFPALAALLVVTAIVAVICRSSPWSHATFLGMPWVIFYSGNWNVIIYGGAAPLGALGHTWSLSIEEQFYLVWPLILLCLLRWGKNKLHIAAGILAVAILEIGYRFVAIDSRHWIGRGRIYFGTDTHSDGLLIGCALAFALAGSDPAGRARGLLHRILGPASILSLLVLGVLIKRTPDSTNGAELVAIPMAAAATAVIVAHLVTKPLFLLRAVLEWRPMLWVGRRSYGLYLWHNAIFWMLTSVHPTRSPSLKFDVIRVSMAFVATALSYRFVELPFLARKRKYEATEAIPPATAGQGAESGVSP